MAKVAFVGLGGWATWMAGISGESGHEVTVYNRTAAKAEKWWPSMVAAARRTPRRRRRAGSPPRSSRRNADPGEPGKDGIFAGVEKGASSSTNTLPGGHRPRVHAEAKKGGFRRAGPGVAPARRERRAHQMCGGDEGPFRRARKVMRPCPRLHAARRLRLRAARQDGEPDLHRRRGNSRKRQLRAESRPRRRKADRHHISKGAAQSCSWRIAGKTMTAANTSASPADRMRKDRHLSQRRRRNGARPGSPAVDQFYAQVQKMGGKR
jgi:3-hydroxyisobutyrate dehydrogenase